MVRLFTSSVVALVLGTAIAVIPVRAAEDDSSSWPFWRMDHMMSGDWGQGGAMGWWRPDGTLDRLDGRLAYIKTELKISPEQGAAWDEFAGAVKSSARSHNDMMLAMREAFETGST